MPSYKPAKNLAVFIIFYANVTIPHLYQIFKLLTYTPGENIQLKGNCYSSQKL